MEEFAAFVRSLRPDATFGTNHSIWSYGWLCGTSEAFYRGSDYLTGDFDSSPVDESLICKLFQGQVFSAIANNGRFLFIDAVDPVGTVNRDA